MYKFDLNKFLIELEKLCNIESGSRDVEGISRIADYFEKLYSDMGLYINRSELKTGSCLEIKTQNTEPIDILMIGHMDTVFPKGTVAEWGYTNDGKRAYGPGVVDMKSGLLLIYEILKKLGKEFRESVNICILMNPDEEISSIESKQIIIEKAKLSKYALIFEPSRINGAMVNQRKGLSKYLIKFKGKPAHAGVDPENGRSAALALAKVMLEINQLVDLKNGLSLNFGLIKGGSAPNVIPENAEGQLDIRFTEMSQLENVYNRLLELKEELKAEEVDMEFEVIGERPPFNPGPKTMELIELFNKTAKEVEGIDLEWVSTGGVSDGNFTNFHGVPTLDAIGVIGGKAHSRDEYLEINSIEPRINIISNLIFNMKNNILI